MTVPYGHHARRRTPLPVAVRHALLWLLPTDDETHDTWRGVACAFGDLLEDFFALVAITVTIGLAVAIAMILAWLSIWLLAAVLGVSAIALAGWRIRVAVGNLERLVDEEAPR